LRCDALRESWSRGIFGIRRPVLLLPEGITDRLTPAQLQAVLSHELCHVRRRDNLGAAIHMIVEAVFWFHPLVWWIERRLVDEREKACDEEVLRLGNEPQSYAEGILKVCEFCLASPLVCASGVTGSNLTKRIEAIMEDRAVRPLTVARRLLLAGAGIAAVAAPIAIGIMNSSRLRAQTVDRPVFEVASVKPFKQGSEPENRKIETSPGNLRMRQQSLRECIDWAYGATPHEFSGPAWLSSEQYDIIAKAATPATIDQMRLMLQALLAERFKLTLHREQRVMPSYALVVAKGGPKLHEVQQEPQRGFHLGTENGNLSIRMVERMPRLAAALRMFLDDRPVVDETRLTGVYEISLSVELDADHKPLPELGHRFNGFGWTPGVIPAVGTVGAQAGDPKRSGRDSRGGSCGESANWELSTRSLWSRLGKRRPRVTEP